VDASYYVSTGQEGWGFITRDSDGNFLAGGAWSIPRAANALQAETLGVLISLERVAELGMTRIILETDVALVRKAITSRELDRSPNGCLFRQIREVIMSYFLHCIVTICPRSCNSVADSLASYGCTLEQGSCRYMSQALDFVLALVSGDLPRTIS
jgi:ribonuclease HI